MNLMAKAKARMLINNVFFATLVLSTRMEENRSIPTAATDMIKIMYNPDFIAGLDDPDVVTFVLAHEVMHIVLKHGIRRGSRNPSRWNIACDFAINLMLRKSGFKIWDRCYCDDKYDGMSAEQIYDQREQEREERRKKGGGGDEPGKGRGKPGQGTADNGSNEEDDDALGGDVMEPENLDPETRATIERAINQKVAQATSIARMAGQLPGEIERLVDGILNPPLPWQQLLREFATQVSHNDECWAHRNRRHQAIYLPGKFSLNMGEIVMIGDTSGSMGDDVFAQIGAEMNEIVEFVHPERVRMIWADDDECSREEVFEDGDTIVLHPKGGGGTDMRKPLKFVEKYDPIVVILITDGYTPWPSEEPPYPLIVCCTTEMDCPVGNVVRMNV